MSSAIELFATPADLAAVLCVVERKLAIKYILSGQSEDSTAQSWATHQEIEGLGIAKVGDRNHLPSYLIIEDCAEPVARGIVRRDGSVSYAVDQELNPDSIELLPGGIFAEDCVIAGQLGNCSKDERSRQLFAGFATVIREQFSQLRSYRVGPEAERILRAGGRLTASVNAPIEYDLRVD